MSFLVGLSINPAGSSLLVLLLVDQCYDISVPSRVSQIQRNLSKMYLNNRLAWISTCLVFSIARFGASNLSCSTAARQTFVNKTH